MNNWKALTVASTDKGKKEKSTQTQEISLNSEST